MSHLWQHPYVNVFKHFNLQSWKKSTKEGEVSTVMDKTLKCTVYRVTGSIPAGNYIQLPKAQSQSLGLTGRYFYLLFKPIPTKYFVVHIDVATQDNLIVRISFSNLFKEFKSTSTWLQFPFLCNASRGSVQAYASVGSKDHSGPAPMSTRWTVLCLDMNYILSMYLNGKFSYIKNVKLCANMLVKNMCTSDLLYEVGLTFEQAKKAGRVSHDVTPMPRDLAFPLLKGDKWDDLYDMIRFPNEGSRKPFDSIQFENIENSGVSEESSINSSQRVVPKKVDVSKCVSERISLIHNMTQPRQKAMKRIQVTKELPMIGVDDIDIHRDDEGEIHVFAHPTDDVVIHQDDRTTGESVNVEKVRGTAHVPATRKSNYTALEPDPILKLRRIVGFGGATFKDALWSVDGSTVVYPCHAVVVAMKVSNGHQRFFIGHTDKVSCISMTGNSTMLASGQTGNLSVVRVWKFNTGDCLAMCKTHVHSLHCLSFAHKGNMLCGVGKDSQGKNMVVIWNTSKVMKNREITVTAKAHTDVDIVRLRVSAFDDTRMVSCGRDNVRLWRVKEGQLRSAPVNLGEHHSMEFTDVAFEAGYHADKDPSDRLVYACSRSGHIFEIELQKVAIRHVRRLLPNASKSKDKDKQTFRSGPGIGLNCMSVNETFCVTGSDDGYLRLWPLDFAHVYLEAEHEGPVTSADFSSDGLHILAGTATGNLGMLDVTTRSYTTMMRSHTGRITGVAVDPYRKHLATVSEDHTIRVWDSETLQQLYDFSAPSECPCTISYHPSRQIFACGFENGIVRVFNVQTTSMMAEHKQHRGKVIGLSFAPTGDFLFSACSLGSLALYDATADNFPLLRLLANTVARGERRGPQALSVSPDGRRMAFIGPSEFIVSVVDSKSLDEVLRIDISNISASDSGKAVLDSAMRVYFAPQSLGHLLVTTANNKLLKFDARTGRILAEVNNIHRSGCSTLTVTDNGRYLATGGDKTIKIWDYNMKLDINFQVFIGHSENVSKIVFTPDSKNLLSVGEAVYMWDFLAVRPSSPTEGREIREMSFPFMDKTESFDDIINVSYRQDLPRTPPKPIMKSPGDRRGHFSPSRQSKTASFSRIDDLSSIHKPSTETEFSDNNEPVLPVPEVRQKYDTTSDSDSVDSGPRNGLGSRSKVQQHKKRTPVKKKRAPSRGRTPKKDRNSDGHKPTCKKHFQQRKRFYGLAQRRYIAPPNQAGVHLKSIIGYNGNAKNSLIWQSDTGLFVYTTGCVLIVEDLNTGDQKHLTGHTEEISTLSLQNDCQVLASASGSFGMSPSQIIIWDLEQYLCRKVLNHHEFDIQCLAYSRDDRFLISVGDYRDCSIVVWSTDNYEILTTSRAASPVHELKWDPYTVNEFATVGQNSTVLFWLLDETTTDVCLNVHEAEVPEELLEGHHKDVESVDFTAMEYAGDSTLYISTSSGKVSAWDTRHNTCFIHWEADKSEIDVIMCRSGRLLTGSVGKNLRVWSIVGVGELKLPGDHNSMRTGGLTMEDEMNLDGSIVTAAFDEALDMGIVGTSSGTLWYINWPERTSIRLVSSHMAKVNNLSLCNSEHFASCADDGSVRVWSIDTREQTLQFQVLDQACTCIAFSPVKPDGIVRTTVSNTESAPVTAHQKIDAKFMPLIAAGYSDGTVRVFDINKAEMILKMHPHAVAVTAISFSSDGRMVITGGSEGLIAVSSPTTGMTVRVISDHKGAPITNIDVSVCQEQELSVSAPQLWLATSADRRVSVWSADWSKDFCELVDWLTFPAPAFTPDGTVIAKQDQKTLYSQLPPSIAKFSPEESDIIVYVGYGMEKCIQFYSLSERKVLRTQALTHWPTCMDLAQSTALVSLGANERVMKLLDYYEGSFQDFVGHSDSINFVKFSPDSKYLLTVSHSEIFIWEVQV